MSEIQIIETAVVDEIKTLEADAAKIEDNVEAEVLALYEKLRAEEIAAKLEAEKLIAPVENLVEAAEQEVKKVVESYFHPEQASRPVLNHTIGTSQIRNPA